MTATKPISLKNHFLIAMPNMSDPNFAHSITYICEHNEEGAMGIVINRPMDVSVGDILAHLKISHYDEAYNDIPVMCGGPVQMERGFVLHRSSLEQWENCQQVDEDICLSSSRDILMAIAHNEGPRQNLVALGYAGWGAGQLDEEMAQNAWLSVKADADIIFDTPYDQRWQAAANLLGIDLNLLSDQIGHA